MALRAREAVIGGAAKGGSPDAELYGYTVVRYPEALGVLRDDATFSSAGYQASMGVMLGHSIVSMDRPEHTHYRGLIQQAFSRGAMHRWESELVREIVDRLLDPIVEAGGGDIVKAVTFPLPMQVIGGMFGLPDADLNSFHREAIAMVNMGHDWDRALQGSRWLHDYFLQLIQQRRAEPGGGDIISVLIAAEEDGQRLDDEEIIAFLRNMLPAAADTTYRATSNLLQGLLRRPEQLEALRTDRSLIPKAIEEGLRWESPITAIARTATRDVEVGGTDIPAGSMVTVSIGAANHDQERWGPTAEDLDIRRPSMAHLSFANGPHVCLGIQLARMESRVFLERVLDRMPRLRMDPDVDPARSEISGLVFRSPAELRVVFG
ncbi:cytochrome P450 [Sporichthya brevicatena]|uniref:cytochrome P450 n=1 Tax=Sporichthya brevicatena TaxID=171442 RepID=UPI0031DC7E0A